jgi:hypothetical protein
MDRAYINSASLYSLARDIIGTGVQTGKGRCGLWFDVFIYCKYEQRQQMSNLSVF